MVCVVAAGAGCADARPASGPSDAAERDPDATELGPDVRADGAEGEDTAAATWTVDPGAEHAVRALADFRRPTFYAAPWPSDDLLRDEGVDLSGFPNPDRTPYVTELVRLASGQAGFGITAPIYFAFDGELDRGALPDVWSSVSPATPVGLAPLDADGVGTLAPLDVAWLDRGGPHLSDRVLALLPYQGFPLRPSTTYVAWVRRSLGDAERAPLGAPAFVVDLAAGRETPLTPDVARRYRAALGALAASGVPVDDIAALSVFTTHDPSAQLIALASTLPDRLEIEVAPFLSEVYDDFCVLQAEVRVPVYQQGEPPYDRGGGHWSLDEDGNLSLQGWQHAIVWLTVPRSAPPEPGFPTVVFVRTGGGGNRPLIDRGARAAPGEGSDAGTGPASHLARAGIAGISIDGPHGGLRNLTGRDEQLLIFNFQNLAAMRDNIRQSALELTLVPELLDRLELDASMCPGTGPSDRVLDVDRVALMGHSMGATIAPLAAAAQPRFSALVLSGAGGSWIENVVLKRSPVPVRPIAELLLRYAPGQLHRFDPALALLQWAGEPADPPVYARHIVRDAEPGAERDVLMFQGITDTYILPPSANALSLALGLDLADAGLEHLDPETAGFTPLEALLPLAGARVRPLPIASNLADGAATGAVVQLLEDGVEDGHEVMFQLPEAPRHYARFLRSWARGSTELSR